MARIAIIGSGIGGLGAAWLLSRRHEVDVFERDDRIGGHTHTTRTTGPAGEPLALDSGFIVHNEKTYPLLVRMLRELGVRTQDSSMGFSVACEACGVEYSGVGLWRQPRALRTPGFSRLVRDIVRFQRTGTRALEPERAGLTLGDFAEAEGYSRGFMNHYLGPLASAIWSSGSDDARDFPASYAVGFWQNHGILGFRRLTWKTITGGSDTYVRRITDRLPGRVHASMGVEEVRRHADHVEIRTADGQVRHYDQVVMAAHAGQSLAMLADATEEERRVLGAFRTTPSDVTLHRDETLLPTHPSSRAAWNHHVADCAVETSRPSMTYSLNRLQRLRTRPEWCVSLNRDDEVDPDLVVMRTTYEHPAYDFRALGAQDAMARIQGAGRTWYSGAWMGYGFHEDGLRAAVSVARGLGVEW